VEGFVLAVLPVGVVCLALVANYLLRVRGNAQRTLRRR
jgi:hypothetical protein